MESISSLMLLVICAFVILCGLLFLHDFLHNRYHDDLLEQIALLIEALVEQFDSAESNADAGKGADHNPELRYFPPNQNYYRGSKYLFTFTGLYIIFLLGTQPIHRHFAYFPFIASLFDKQSD